ncbi:hypothetical protein ACT4US_30115 [Bacillus sp. HC-Mk]
MLILLKPKVLPVIASAPLVVVENRFVMGMLSPHLQYSLGQNNICV